MKKIKSSEITPEHVYLSRRKFIAGISTVALTSTVLAACGVSQDASPVEQAEAVEEAQSTATPTSQAKTETPMPGTENEAAPESGEAPAEEAMPEDSPFVEGDPQAQAQADELGDTLTQYEAVTNFNNYYEFTTDKEAVATLAQGFRTSPWEVEISGMVNKPGIYDLDKLMRFQQEERVYRLRCVEGWSMVIPWIGFPLAALLQEVEPTSNAQYVRFETLFDPDQMPGQRNTTFQWPYIEGLRMDEAMNDLAILATGVYGKPLPPQNGAPVRLVVPWKYGFKSIKSIVKIELTDQMPTSLWMDAAPNEYGFFANVNPEVDHPRWSQGTERRIGEFGRRETLKFNGYEEEVAYLYEGMDLAKFY